MSKAEKRSYITGLWSIPAWIAIVLANLSFSYIFELDFSFDLFKLVFIPTIILIFCFLGIKLSVLGIFNRDERKALRLNLIFFVLINGLWGTYICVTQPNIYNGFSVLFMFLIGPVFLNRVLGFKGTLIFCCFFFCIFLFFLNYEGRPFEQDEKLLSQFLLYSAIVFGVGNQSALNHINKNKKSRKIYENFANDLRLKVKQKTHELEIEKLMLEDANDHYEYNLKARNELLGSLNQGYLTFNNKGTIQEGATEVTKKYLRTEVLHKPFTEGIKIWNVLFDEESSKKNFQKWVEKVFEGKFLFKDLIQLAPKRFENNKDKYIELEFRPIYEEGSSRKIDKIIMIASDKTQELKLEKRLEEDRQNVEFIKTSLQNPSDFLDIISDADLLIEEYFFMDDKKIYKETIFRYFHNLKAQFSQFGLRSISKSIDEIENILSENEFDNLDKAVEIFKRELNEFIKNNRNIFAAINKLLVDEGAAIPVSELMEKEAKLKNKDEVYSYIRENYLFEDIKKKFFRYIPLIDEISEKQGKNIDVLIVGDEIKVDVSRYKKIVDASIHLFRNIVDHGIETQEERIEKTKPQRGNIKVDFKNNGDSFIINITDDGRGIDPFVVKNKIVEKGLKEGKEIMKYNESDIIDLIFLPGFSTKDDVNELSGRGVGMDSVREEIKGIGGKISVSSKVDEGTKFLIKLPILK